MDEPTFVVTWNCNRIAVDAWIDERKRPDGDYDLIGMGRRMEYDALTGAVVSDKTEPTGITGWAPREAIEGSKKSWRSRLFGAE